MNFTSRRKRRIQLIFWAAIALVLVAGARQLVADPTRFGSTERTPVIISEFLVAHADPNAPAGWLELYNRSNQRVDLANWTLTDDPTDPEKWTFPSVEIESNGYLLVWSDDAAPADAENEIVANVTLAAAGGFLALYPPTASRFGDAISLDYYTQFADISFGRADPQAGDGRYSYLASATPNAANDGNVVWQGMSAPVVASVGRGFFSRPFRTTLQSQTPNAQIRYTVDGSTPTESNGMVYDAPIEIEQTAILRATAFVDGFLPSNTTTHTYLFPADIVQQSANPSADTTVDWPDTWGKHRLTFLGYEAGAPVESDYEMDPEITQHPEYADQMVESLLAIPSLSLVTDMANLDIYFADPQARGVEAERAASVEFLYPDEPNRNMQSGTGLRIQGGAGRWEFMPKHPFRLLFKERYGASRLRHKVFDDSPLESFNTLTLRAGVNRGYAGHPNTVERTYDHRLVTYTRDEFARDTQIAISGFGSRGTFVHLYLNGLYWGLYNIVERPDRVFAADYFGGDVEKWFTATHGGAGEGQIDRFTVMLQLAKAGGLADPKKYATMLEFIDPIQFADYLIINWYIGTQDWPDNNWYVNVSYPAGRNLFFVWDAEMSWIDGTEIRLGPDPKADAPFPNVAKLVFSALIENENFRRLLGDRLAEHLHPNGALGDAQVMERWRAIVDPLERAIIAESARWGDARYEAPITQADWRSANEAVLAQIADNGSRLLDQARVVGYYPVVDSPEFSQHGGAFADRLTLHINAPVAESGEILYTLDGQDPAEGDAIVYSDPIEIDGPVTVKARQRRDGGWSALTEAGFARSDQAGDIRITEIMYNPRDGAEFGVDARSADFYEFIEIQNVGEDAVDLSLAFFEGIDFVFPNYTTIGAGEIKVLIRDFRAFRQRYPTADFHGTYAGKLSNRGETITLRNRDGESLASVTYDDSKGWPVSADGFGDSLTLSRVDGDSNAAQSWGVSATIHGSPGKD